MLAHVKAPSRCGPHDRLACPICKIDRTEAHFRGAQAMHDQLVWMFCNGAMTLEALIGLAVQDGVARALMQPQRSTLRQVLSDEQNDELDRRARKARFQEPKKR